MKLICDQMWDQLISCRVDEGRSEGLWDTSGRRGDMVGEGFRVVGGVAAG